jgi:hypothetical protein
MKNFERGEEGSAPFGQKPFGRQTFLPSQWYTFLAIAIKRK